MRKKMICLAAVPVLALGTLAGCQGKDETANVSSDAGSTEEYTTEIFAMDTYMTLTAYGENAQEAVEAGVEEIQRLDELLSAENQESEVWNLNASGGGVMSEDTAYLVERALEIYESTDGAFDISIHPVMALWGFITGDFAVPSEEELQAELSLVDASRLSVDDSSGSPVLSMDDGMEIDLGGIAKGYTSQRVIEIFREYGIESAVINLGGNAHVLGSKTDGSAWRIGIQDPEDSDGYLGGVEVVDKAVITSGGYERYFEDETTGIRYHHIIDPSTGYPANNGLISVTIISEDGTLADGLSTSLFVMGTEKAVAYCEEHCVSDGFDVVLEDENGTIYMTDRIEDDFIHMNEDESIEIIETE